jgi:hypothetical protein
MVHGVDASAIGPVDVAVIEFAGGRLGGDIGPALIALSDAGIVRFLDLAVIRKDADGAVDIVELEDADLNDLPGLDDNFDLLSSDDLLEISNGLAPGTSALAIVWANSWSVRFAEAVRGSGGRLVRQDRVPHEEVLAAFASVDSESV